MRRLRVVILDLLDRGPSRPLWGHAMQPNFASIMPQAIGVWCEQAGHEVRHVCYTGAEDLKKELPTAISSSSPPTRCRPTSRTHSATSTGSAAP
jgi:hypothetical protein